jgi:lipopolysaccharide export system protein LptA
MTRDATRLLRAALLLTGLGVAGAVAVSLRRPASAVAPEPTAPTDAPSGAASAAPATRMDELVYRNVKGGVETFVLRARRMLGREQEQMRLETVSLEFSYVMRGEPGRGTIESDECLYYPARQEAQFRGHVKLHTEDGFELASESLVWLGQDGRVTSDLPVEFRRKSISGSSRGIEYRSEPLEVDLLAEVEFRIADEARGATVIRAARASMKREAGEFEFDEDVRVERGSDVLTADQLLLIGTLDEIDRSRAVGNVRLTTSSADLLAAQPGRALGARTLSCGQLDINFREDMSLEDASALQAAELVVMPAPREARERRILRGGVLVFRWDEQGRLQEVQGQRGTELISEPLAPGGAPARTLRGRAFVARLDPVSGELREAEFNREVEFNRGKQRAHAEHGQYDGTRGILNLTEEPVVWDDSLHTRLEAEAIQIVTQTGDLRASQGVRQTVEAGTGRPGLMGGDQPVSLASREFEYDGRTRIALYRGEALLRTGRSEVRAPAIRTEETAAGRRLVAEGGASARLVAAGARADAPPTEGRGRQMVYDEGPGTIVFTGDAWIRQGEVQTKSPEATIQLGPDGREVRGLVAGSPVELTHGSRVATGSRATYTPKDGTIVVVGDKVELKDPSQKVQGRSLTFFVGDDRILIDGREEMRTETVFRRTPS